MPVNGVWQGCGHEVKNVRLGRKMGQPSMRDIVNFKALNKKDQCFECWQKGKRMARREFEWKRKMRFEVRAAYWIGFICPKCGGMMKGGKAYEWPRRIKCNKCGDYYDVGERPCPKCGSPDMITRPNGSATCPNTAKCDYKEGVSAEGI